MAEAVAIVELVASIAGLVDLSIKVISRLRDFSSKASEIPESFRSLSTRLPLLTEAVQNIQSQAEAGSLSESSTTALKGVVEDTFEQVATVQTSLSKILPSDGASKLERALKALKSLSKEDKIQQTLETIHKNCDILVLYQTTRHADTSDRILAAVSKLSLNPPQLPSPLSTIPFRRDPDFVDRGAFLDQLSQKRTVPASRTALVGLGGVGKSQLAIEFGYRTREHSPGTWVLWVHAGSPARFEQSLRVLADDVKIPGRQESKADIFKLVHDWLRDERNGQWLLILDNVDDLQFVPKDGDSDQKRQSSSNAPQPISAIFPQSQNGSMLVTSRNKAVALELVEQKDIIAVDPMAPLDALALLEKKLGSLSEGRELVELAETLEFMPLAITQAAAYISQRSPRYSARRYLEEFRKSDRKKTSLLNHEGGQLRRDWEAQNSVITTWQISFEYIRRNRSSAADLLSLMSFFDRQGIPEDLIRKQIADEQSDKVVEDLNRDRDAMEDEDDEKSVDDESDSLSRSTEDDGFEDDVQILRDYSFLSVNTDSTFEMHALVQLATRKWLDAHGLLETWKHRFIHNLSAEFPYAGYEDWKVCEKLYPHAKSAVTQRPKGSKALGEWADLIHNAAFYALERSYTNEAYDLCKTSMEVREKLFGQEHKRTLASMYLLGQVYHQQQRWKEAEELQEQWMEMGLQIFDEESIEILAMMNNLAISYSHFKRFEEAELLYTEALRTYQKVLGEEDPTTLTTMGLLSSMYWHQDRIEEAEKLEIHVMNARRRVLGNEHPGTLSSMNNLATVYLKQGRLEESEKLQVQVLKARQKVLGNEHHSTLNTMDDLSTTYLKLQRWKEAEEVERQLWKARQKVLGEEHRDTRRCMDTLASIYRDLGRWDKAEEQMMGAWKIRQRVLGEEHPTTMTTLYNVAVCRKEQSQDAEAMELMERCLHLQRRILGPDHSSTALTTAMLAEWREESTT